MITNQNTKFWATNRGWISTKFAVKNPVSHFLNLYKKKPISKKQEFQIDNKLSISSTQHLQKDDKFFDSKEPYIIKQLSKIKPQTAPTNLKKGLIEFSKNEKEPKKKQKTLLPKRSQSLHMKRTKNIDNSITSLRASHNSISKLKKQNQQSLRQSQRNFKPNNCGRFKPQLMFLQPKIRHSSANFRATHNKTSQQILQREKTSIYHEITKSLDTDQRIQQAASSVGMATQNFIQYMTEYGQINEQQILTENIKIDCFEENNMKKIKQSRNIRRKPNLNVLRNKLHFQYRKSEYRQKMDNIDVPQRKTFFIEND